MRTISATVRTREEAEAAGRRLEAIGIQGDRILFKEVGEPGGHAGGSGIFVTVKVAPEQVSAATDILNSAAAAAREPVRAEPARQAPQAFAAAQTDRAAAAPTRVRVTERSTSAPRVEPAAPHVERVERSTVTSHAEGRAAPARHHQSNSPTLARIAAVAALLAGLGFAAGAALGIVF